MNQKEKDNKIESLRLEKMMLIKSKEKLTNNNKILATEKRIMEVNRTMKKIRNEFKKEREKENEKY